MRHTHFTIVTVTSKHLWSLSSAIKVGLSAQVSGQITLVSVKFGCETFQPLLFPSFFRISAKEFADMHESGGWELFKNGQIGLAWDVHI